MTSRHRTSVILAIFSTLTFAGCLHTPPTHEHGAVSPPSEDSREHMALVHEQAAGCLRAGQPMAECHQKAMQAMGPHMNHPMDKGMGKKRRMGKQGMAGDACHCKMMEGKQATDEPAPDAHKH